MAIGRRIVERMREDLLNSERPKVLSESSANGVRYQKLAPADAQGALRCDVEHYSKSQRSRFYINDWMDRTT